MERSFFIFAGLCTLGVLAAALLLRWLERKGVVDTSKERVRRGTGHAMLGLQEFVEPSVEYVFQAQNVEQKEDEDREAGGEDDIEAIQADLARSLSASPVDAEEVRRHLASASRAGLDWQETYEKAVREELAARPFRAPSIPPVWRVRPRE
jgi:hypothetical protein